MKLDNARRALVKLWVRVAWGPQALILIARRCLACRAQRGPLGVLPKVGRNVRQALIGGKRRKEPRSPARLEQFLALRR